MATLVVFLVVFLAFGGVLTLFALPLAEQGTQLAARLPDMIADARGGRGPVGTLLERTNALEFPRDNEERIRQFATGLGTPALNLLRSAVTGIVATISIFVLAYLAVLQGPKVIDGTLALFPPQRAQRIHRVGRECAKTVTGYITGNLLISVICGVLTYIVLKILGVPFAELIAVRRNSRPDPSGGRHPRRGGRRRRRAHTLAARGHHRDHLLHRLPAAGEPPAPAGDLLPHGPAQPVDRARRVAAGDRTRRNTRRLARHPGRPARRLAPPRRSAGRRTCRVRASRGV
nr:AI-2E family transporter [Lentzea terrae]